MNDFTRSTSSRDPVTTPPSKSEWPPKYFVAECRTPSTPSLCGWVLSGVANVESISETMPHALATDATRSISTSFNVGFVGDSTYTTLVLSRIALSKPETSMASNQLTSTP